MLKFIFQKMLKKKWMVVSLLIGNFLLIAIAASNPMYSQAVLQRTLTRNLGTYLNRTNEYPGIISAESVYYGTIAVNREQNYQKLVQASDLIDGLLEELDVPVLYRVTNYYKSSVDAKHELEIEGEKNKIIFQLSAYSGVEDHIQIVNGEMYSTELKDNTIDVVVNEKTFVKQNLMLGEVMELPNLKNADGEPYRLRIAGIFKSNDAEDLYWTSNTSEWDNACIMDYDLFCDLFASSGKDTGIYNVEWYAVLDYTKIRGDEPKQLLEVLNRYQKALSAIGVKGSSANFATTLQAFVPEAQKLNTTIWVLQVPILVLLAAFIFMVSRQMLEMEQNEMAVFKSRGAGKKQILLLYLLQSVVIAVLGLAGGIPLGVLMCRVLGSANAFLEFVQRSALPIELGFKVWLFAGIAAAFSICTMVLPVFRYADVNIVAHKRKKNRAEKRPWWQRLFLDVVLMGVSIYGWYRFNGQTEYLAQKVLDGEALDPLIYLCSSLFMIGAGLLVLRIFPLLIRLVFTLGKRWWPPSIYASFLRIMRTRSNQGFIMVFLVLTVSMGLFNAQTAETINRNAEEEIRYTTGADIVLQEVWGSNSRAVQEDTTGTVKLEYEEPYYEKYLDMDGIESVTKVLKDTSISIQTEKGKLANVTLMGINTKEFGETAWFKESLMSRHWYEYLNAMSQNSQAILVSSNLKQYIGCEVGDTLTYTNKNGESLIGVICGFVDYWPSFSSSALFLDETTGMYKTINNCLIVAHLPYIQSAWGVTPYQIWIKAEDSTQFIYDYASETKTGFTVFKDASAQIINKKNDPVFQGTNGILTVGFICVLLLCITGFLIYWILSIQSRTLQFGIFRAMGMALREVLSMLICELFLITGVSIASGVLIGNLTSRMFIPLIQIGYSSASQSIPLEIVSAGSSYIRLFGVIGFAIVVCLVILGMLISRIKISQALKLGED